MSDPEWDPKRTSVLQYSLTRFLLPQLKRELEAELLQSAQEAVAVECTAALKKRLDAGPFYANAEEHGVQARKNGFYLVP